ncbi:MAG: BrnT family toxin [Lachnospiraceae bacterium]|nr:BrnT family toxin [Lachnospiraceae bacterium]
MKYEWDPKKNEENIRKHKISFPEAAKALESGEIIYDIYDDVSSAIAGEDRYIAIVRINAILLIVYTMRESETVTRLISARKIREKEVKRLC